MHAFTARFSPLLASLLALAPAPPARAVVVDGHLDAAYVLTSTQTTQTSAADDQQAAIGFGTGSELDAAYAGVTAGCAAASGSGVTTGVELAIPLAAIGDPTNCIGVCAFVYATPARRSTWGRLKAVQR